MMEISSRPDVVRVGTRGPSMLQAGMTQKLWGNCRSRAVKVLEAGFWTGCGSLPRSSKLPRSVLGEQRQRRHALSSRGFLQAHKL